jgi:hypothetical protein
MDVTELLTRDHRQVVQPAIRDRLGAHPEEMGATAERRKQQPTWQD